MGFGNTLSGMCVLHENHPLHAEVTCIKKKFHGKVQQQAGRQRPERLINRNNKFRSHSAGFCSGGNTLTPETKKMGSPSDRVLRTEVLLPIETRRDLKSLQCSPRKEESGQNGTGSVTNNMRLKKSCCHQRVSDDLRGIK